MTGLRGVRTRLVAAAVVPLCVIGVAACGIPDGGYNPVSNADLALLAASTTTTTTTTLPTTTAPPTTAPAETVPPTEPTTSSTVPTELFDFFFLSGDKLVPAQFPLSPGASADQVLQVLANGVEQFGPAAAALRTAIPSGAAMTVTSKANGVVTVDINPDGITRVAEDLRFEFGQIVLTLLNSQTAIGQVTFTVGGSPIPFENGSGAQISAGGVASTDSYTSVLATP